MIDIEKREHTGMVLDSKDEAVIAQDVYMCAFLSFSSEEKPTNVSRNVLYYVLN